MKFKQNYFYILLVAVAVGYFYLVFTNYDENKQQTYDSAVSSQIKTVKFCQKSKWEKIWDSRPRIGIRSKFIQNQSGKIWFKFFDKNLTKFYTAFNTRLNGH